ncbi:MAG: hypothetical protein EP330_21555 [Deltaproteobacteria bacterium]|nr:MAG: hypothetical protein EP330_21555 [Deltaproteobacteria bacterium]
MGAHWTLSLDDTFTETELDGQTGFVRDDQAVILAPFETQLPADEAIDKMGLETEGVLEHLPRSGGAIRREAVIVERDGGDESRFALQGFVAVAGSLLAVGFYWESEDDREWAVEAFRAIGVE